jgi:transcriptional regulator with XRE-family HTH domain
MVFGRHRDPFSAAISRVFLERLDEEMAAQNIASIPELARFIGVSRGTAYRWREGGLPDVESLWKLCQATSTEADWWLGRIDYRRALTQSTTAMRIQAALLPGDLGKPFRDNADAIDRARERTAKRQAAAREAAIDAVTDELGPGGPSPQPEAGAPPSEPAPAPPRSRRRVRRPD